MLSTCLMGQTGPLATFAGLRQPRGGDHRLLQPLTGWPDRAPAGPFGAYTDYIAPRFTAAAILAALDHRRRTGEGQYIDLARRRRRCTSSRPAILDYTANGRVQERAGQRRPRARAARRLSRGRRRSLGRDRGRNDEQWRSSARRWSDPTSPQTHALRRAAARREQQREARRARRRLDDDARQGGDRAAAAGARCAGERGRRTAPELCARPAAPPSPALRRALAPRARQDGRRGLALHALADAARRSPFRADARARQSVRAREDPRVRRRHASPSSSWRARSRSRSLALHSTRKLDRVGAFAHASHNCLSSYRTPSTSSSVKTGVRRRRTRFRHPFTEIGAHPGAPGGRGRAGGRKDPTRRVSRGEDLGSRDWP